MLHLLRNSGLLSFHYKFYSLYKSILEVSVCPDSVPVRIPDNDYVYWQMIENITVYCDGREPQIRFFASEIDNSHRIAFDNIKVVSTSPPTTTTTRGTTTRTTRRKPSTTTIRASTTTPTATTITRSMTTTPATSERSTSSSSAFTGLKRTKTIAISVSLAAVVIALASVGIIGIARRKKSRGRPAVDRADQEMTTSGSLNPISQDNDAIYYEATFSNIYSSVPTLLNKPVSL
nr:uncharacterized protein LOC129280348 [Lytechinus pictus]